MVTVAFLAAVIIKDRKLPDSISAMVYSLPRSWQWVWIVWMWVVSVVTCIPVIESLPDDFKSFGFLTMGCLALCGSMPLIRQEENTLHYVFAVTAGVLSQICVVVCNPWLLLLWAIMLPFVMGAFAGFNDSKDIPVIAGGKGVLLAEMICYISLILIYVYSL